jgi:VanZ family protein
MADQSTPGKARSPGRQFVMIWLPLILWAMLLFILSSYQYPEKTAVVTNFEQQFDQIDIPSISIRPLLPQQTLTEAITLASKNETARRSVHVFLYLVLGFLTLRAIRTTRNPHPGWVSFLAGNLYGLSDEFHQVFIPGRTFQLLDLAADAFGVLFGVLLFQLFMKIRPSKLPNK